ncbi:hypothetical protein BDEG_27326 [Batrachochytrium dendrobatidis JEL423]|uniref:Major facilitator superfamily (MFS) profile domain-containing protein n=1 Tax=Batrachochytrium dendrobatidis (strain JEL423) TaxID=403673 RepID=A0A177WWL4_BATDL|nr:hypothetical protein BDEG_27326 [Batrachochytrium dendrobatidis JEL423]
MSPVLGIISDKLQGRRLPMIFGLVGLIASTLLFMFAKTFWVLALGRLLQGISTGTVWTLGLALVADTHDSNDLGAAMGIIYGAYAAGQLAGPPIGAVLYTRVGYQAPFIFCCSLTLIDLIVMLIYVELPISKPSLEAADLDETFDSTAVKSEENEMAVHVKSISDAKTAETLPKVRKAPETFWEILTLPPIIIISLVTIVMGCATAAFESTLALHLRDRYGYDVERIGLGFRVVSGVGVAVCAVLAPFLALYQGIVSFLIILITFTMSISSIGMTPMMPEISACVPRSAFARTYSLFNVAFSGGLLFGPIVGSLVYHVGGWFWECIVLFILLILCVPMIFFYKRPVYE